MLIAGQKGECFKSFFEVKLFFNPMSIVVLFIAHIFLKHSSLNIKTFNNKKKILFENKCNELYIYKNM